MLFSVKYWTFKRVFLKWIEGDHMLGKHWFIHQKSRCISHLHLFSNAHFSFLFITQGTLKHRVVAFPQKVTVVMVGSDVISLTSQHQYAIVKMIYACIYKQKCWLVKGRLRATVKVCLHVTYMSGVRVV